MSVVTEVVVRHRNGRTVAQTFQRYREAQAWASLYTVDAQTVAIRPFEDRRRTPRCCGIPDCPHCPPEPHWSPRTNNSHQTSGAHSSDEAA